jgi:hypothetical protein
MKNLGRMVLGALWIQLAQWFWLRTCRSSNKENSVEVQSVDGCPSHTLRIVSLSLTCPRSWLPPLDIVFLESIVSRFLWLPWSQWYWSFAMIISVTTDFRFHCFYVRLSRRLDPIERFPLCSRLSRGFALADLLFPWWFIETGSIDRSLSWVSFNDRSAIISAVSRGLIPLNLSSVATPPRPFIDAWGYP